MKSGTSWHHAIVVLMLTIVWGIFWNQLLTGQIYFAEGDFTSQFYASSQYHVQRLQNGEIALWNPYNYGGQPFAANLQWGAWYPPRWISAVILGNDGWSIQDYQLEVAFHYWLASVMSYVFLFAITKKHFPALVGALIFAYGGYITSYPMLQVAVLQSAIWLPLVLLGITLSFRRSFTYIVLASMGIGLAMLGGHPQTILHIIYFSGAYLLYEAWRHREKPHRIIYRLIVFGVVGTGIGAVQILPSLEFTMLSSRIDQYTYTDIAGGFELAELRHLIVPNLDGTWSPLYISLIGITLAITGMMRRINWFWSLAAIISLLLALGDNTPVYQFVYHTVPGAGVFRRQERFAFLVSFALCVLVSLQIVWLQSSIKSRWLWMIAVIIIADLLVVFSLSDNMSGQAPELEMPEALSPLQVSSPNDIQWRVDGSGGVESYGVYWSMPDIYGTGPLYLESIAALRRIPVHKMWEVMSVRYITTTDVLPPDTDALLIAEAVNRNRINYAVYEITDPRPLAHLVYDSRHAEGSAEFARQIMSDPRVNLREMAVTPFPMAHELPGTRPDSARVVDVRFTRPEDMRLTVSTPENALLTLAIPNYPGWQATINGQPVEIVDVYAGLIGVPVTAGDDQQIRVRFVPQTVNTGAAISTMALLLVIALAVVETVGGRTRKTGTHSVPVTESDV